MSVGVKAAPRFGARRSGAALTARSALEAAVEKQGIERGQLSIHADRGSPMTAKTVAQLYDDLGIIQSHSRPRVRNEDPDSESAFKTGKYYPELLAR